MLKRILFAGVVAFSSAGFSAECVDQRGTDIFYQPEIFLSLIEKAASCHEASRLAEACAYGSSLDVTTAGTAAQVCEKELRLQKPSKSLRNLLARMRDLCVKKYEQEEGTMYRSFNAYCQLSALNWILGLATPH